MWKYSAHSGFCREELYCLIALDGKSLQWCHTQTHRRSHARTHKHSSLLLAPLHFFCITSTISFKINVIIYCLKFLFWSFVSSSHFSIENVSLESCIIFWRYSAFCAWTSWVPIIVSRTVFIYETCGDNESSCSQPVKERPQHQQHHSVLQKQAAKDTAQYCNISDSASNPRKHRK